MHWHRKLVRLLALFTLFSKSSQEIFFFLWFTWTLLYGHSEFCTISENSFSLCIYSRWCTFVLLLLLRSRKSHTHCTFNARLLHTPIYVLFHNDWDERARHERNRREKTKSVFTRTQSFRVSCVSRIWRHRVTETHNVLLHTFDDWSNCYFVRMNAYTNYVRNVKIKMFLIVK